MSILQAFVSSSPQLSRAFRCLEPRPIPSSANPSKPLQTGYSKIIDWMSEGSICRIILKAYWYSMNNIQRLVIITVTVMMCVVCFYWRYSMWAHTPKRELMSWTLPIAKGCGQAMKIVFSLILIPVSRNCLTWARFV